MSTFLIDCIYIGTDKPTLKKLNSLIRDKVASHWYDLGIQLLEDEYIDKLDVIEKNHPGDVDRCCTEMFKYWLKVDPEADWDKLTDALKEINENSLAAKVKKVLKGIDSY